jgi:HlyD family secretion protein
MKCHYPRLIAPVALLGAVACTGCGGNDVDAYGNFEATEVTVAAEVSGRLLSLSVEVGDRVAAGAAVGSIDTVPLLLERQALIARRAAGVSRAREARATIAALDVQRVIADRELARTERLLQARAATAQQGDRAEREARVTRLDDRLARSRIASPQDGTILARYVEPGEFMQSGQPLFKLAALDSLTFRAYVSHAQLTRLRLGQSVRVGVDRADSIATLPGRVTWIASAAEFTPTPIQTREERADQVYAVKIMVANPDGALRIGMPGELVLGGKAAE